LDGLGLFHAVTSYAGNIAVTYTSTRELMPDPEYYGQCMLEACACLLDSVVTAKNAKSISAHRIKRAGRNQPAAI
jgi:hypothetical protein